MKRFLSLLCFFPAVLCAGTLQIFVSEKGNDSAAGSKEAPLASLEGARAVLEKLVLQGGGKLSQPAEIVFAPGNYFFRDGVLFDSKLKFSKDTSLTIRSDGTGKVYFHGGVSFSTDELKPVSDNSILSRLPPEKPEGKLYMLDLKVRGVSNYGKLKKHGFGAADVSPMEVFLNDEPLYLAQYPNKGEPILEIGRVVDDGAEIGPNGKPRAVRPGAFTYEYSRAERWANLKNVWLFGKFSVGYCDDNLPVTQIDTKSKVIRLGDRHAYKIAGGRKHISKKPQYWEVAGLEVRGYVAYNMLEEADKHGEYYIDRDSGIFYVILKEVPKGVIEFSVLESPFLSIFDNDYISIKGIDFKCSRGMGIRIYESTNISVDRCDFYNLGTVAVSTWGNISSALPQRLKPRKSEGYLPITLRTSDIKITNCKIYNTGCGGVIMAGGDRKTLRNSNNLVDNCEFFRTSRVNQTYSPAVRLAGCGGTVSNCDMHDIDHMAIWYNGNDFVIRRNTFARLCDNFDDMGPIYTGRNPTERGTGISENFFTDILPKYKDSNMCGIYIDDGSGGITISRNIFCKVGNSPANSGNFFGAIYIHGGHDNHIRDNLFIDCAIWAGHHAWPDKRWSDYTVSEFGPKVKQVDANSEIYSKRYPDFKGIYGDRIPRNNYAANNRIFRSNGILAGMFTMNGNKVIQKSGVPEYEVWTLDLVKRHFGDDPFVKNLLRHHMGVRK